MKRVLFFILFLSAGSVYAVEEVILTAPVVLDPTTLNDVQIKSLYIDRMDKIVAVTVIDGSNTKTFTYTGDAGLNLIKLINTRDFRTNSLQKQMLQKLISDGYLQGTVTGTAE